MSWARPFSTAARLDPLPRCAITARGPSRDPSDDTAHSYGQPVEPEPPHTRHGQRLGDEGKIVMETGVEARDLRDARPGPPRERDPGQRGRLVSRSEGTSSLDVREHRVVDDGRLPP